MGFLDYFRSQPALNCQIGDIARMVGSESSANRDKLVRVVGKGRRRGWWWVEALQPIYSFPQWVEQPAGSRGNAADKNLRPIRDQPGTDEMLRIAGRPVWRELGNIKPMKVHE